jgi:hypothetical protein
MPITPQSGGHSPVDSAQRTCVVFDKQAPNSNANHFLFLSTPIIQAFLSRPDPCSISPSTPSDAAAALARQSLGEPVAKRSTTLSMFVRPKNPTFLTSGLQGGEYWHFSFHLPSRQYRLSTNRVSLPRCGALLYSTHINSHPTNHRNPTTSHKDMRK